MKNKQATQFINPRRIIAFGIVLVLAGFFIPFLMAIRLIEASFPLCFLAYASSLAGLMLDLIGVASNDCGVQY